MKCKNPCSLQNDKLAHANACASCPLPVPRWGAFGDCQDEPTPAPMRGLGDLVAKIADPIAKTIGLDKSKCECAKRQEMLNQLVPFRRQDSAP
jgi:hypothetical protein